MIKRIEFTLNLNDPQEAALYWALRPALRYRRAGAIIRQALSLLLLSEERPPRFTAKSMAQETSTDEQA